MKFSRTLLAALVISSTLWASPASAAPTTDSGWIVGNDGTPWACLEGNPVSVYIYEFGKGGWTVPNSGQWGKVNGDFDSIEVSVTAETGGFANGYPYFLWTFGYFEGDCLPANSSQSDRGDWQNAKLDPTGPSPFLNVVTNDCSSISTTLTGAATTPKNLIELFAYNNYSYGLVAEIGGTGADAIPLPSGQLASSAEWTFTFDTQDCDFPDPLPEENGETETETGSRMHIDFSLPTVSGELPDTL